MDTFRQNGTDSIYHTYTYKRFTNTINGLLPCIVRAFCDTSRRNLVAYACRGKRSTKTFNTNTYAQHRIHTRTHTLKGIFEFDVIRNTIPLHQTTVSNKNHRITICILRAIFFIKAFQLNRKINFWFLSLYFFEIFTFNNLT